MKRIFILILLMGGCPQPGTQGALPSTADGFLGPSAGGQAQTQPPKTPNPPKPPGEKPKPEKILQLAVGGYQSCALTENHKTFCFTPPAKGWPIHQPGQASPHDGQFQLLAAGPASTPYIDDTYCGVRKNGQIKCWQELFDKSASAIHAVNPDLKDIVQLASGMQSFCALRKTGEIECLHRTQASALATVKNKPVSDPLTQFTFSRWGGAGLSLSTNELLFWSIPSDQLDDLSYATFNLGEDIEFDGSIILRRINTVLLNIGGGAVQNEVLCGINHSELQCYNLNDSWFKDGYGPANIIRYEDVTMPLSQISVAENASCGVRQDNNRVVCWANRVKSDSVYPDLGKPEIDEPMSQISVYGSSVCGLLKETQTLKCYNMTFNNIALPAAYEID